MALQSGAERYQMHRGDQRMREGQNGVSVHDLVSGDNALPFGGERDRRSRLEPSVKSCRAAIIGCEKGDHWNHTMS